MADDGTDEEAWLSQLREALESTRGPADSTDPPLPVAALEDALETDPPETGSQPEPGSAVESAPDPATAAPLPPPPPEPAPSLDTPLILEALAALTDAVQRIETRVDAFEAAQSERGDVLPVVTGFDQVELDVVVADAIRKATMKAQATGAGTVRLETEVRLLEQTVTKLSKQVNDVNLTALARDRLEKDVHVERLAEAADSVQRQLAAAIEARVGFDATVDKMLRHAADGGGADVAWTDVMFLTHELRSRVDDLDDQQRRAMRELSEWQASMDDRLAGMRAQLLDEIRALRDPVD